MPPSIVRTATKRQHKPKAIPAELPRTGLVRDPVVKHFVPISDETRRKKIAAGTFPKPVKIGKRAIAWRAEELHAYIDSLESA